MRQAFYYGLLSRNTSGEQHEQPNWPTDKDEERVPFQPSRHYVSAQSRTLPLSLTNLTQGMSHLLRTDP
jgi:hypothetical protein